ncbi:glycosyltransferase-like domain-containing protein 1-like [Symsagittifera roscoffensis]|uniref:glycosyltransferase-like domain-containing protein 1-like n=1 Tax=Symsagittifera roscoffensis TaxID=84072 RepID=UPI00307BAF58
MDDSTESSLLVLEAFFGGSHKHLLDLTLPILPEKSYYLLTLPATKWHWRSRCSALYFSQRIPRNRKFKKLFLTSCTNLAELIGLRTDLASCEKILYFHENQLVYPRKAEKDRDYQHCHNEIVSALAADKLIFNSMYNQSTFLNNCEQILNKVPNTEFQPIRLQIESKCRVLPVPIDFDKIPKLSKKMNDDKDALHIVWPHRWEHDKNPDLFRDIILELDGKNCDFRLSVLGEKTLTVPESISEICSKIGHKLLHAGFLESKEEYFQTLAESDIVLSTSIHEFQGLAVMEAILMGCFPLCPNRLVYPEYLPEKCLYSTTAQAVKFLTNACRSANSFRKRSFNIDLSHYSLKKLSKEYVQLLE